MASSDRPRPISSILLIAGIACVKFVDDASLHEIYGLGTANPYFIEEGSIENKAVYFTIPPNVDLNEYYIVSELRESSGQAEGKQIGDNGWRWPFGDGPAWEPVKRAAGNVLYVEKDNKQVLVINQAFSKLTTKEKIARAAVGVSVVGAGAVGAVAAFPAVVAALGFGAVGIAAGSTAASMMSAGVVGVATLQSIGAAGMGLASTLVVGGVGAAGAAGAGGAAAHLASRNDGDNTKHVPIAYASGALAADANNIIPWNGENYAIHGIYRAPL